MNPTSLAIFEKFQIRRVYDEVLEKWYFSIVDIVEVLTNSSIPKRYWSDLKTKLREEGGQLYDKIVQLKMASLDGKKYLTDVTDTETILRIIQSIPSPKAEPFKLWLAKVGYERVQEMADPEKALNRSRDYWQRMGRSEKWIQQRMMGQETRNKLTDYWKVSGVERPDEFAALTNIIHKEWSDLDVKGHKDLKGLSKENLRDHMTDAELIFTALAELSTRHIAEAEDSKGFDGNKPPATKGGRIAKDARLALEEKTGKPIVTKDNYLPYEKKKRLPEGKY
jgi:hypothetical protein